MCVRLVSASIAAAVSGVLAGDSERCGAPVSAFEDLHSSGLSLLQSQAKTVLAAARATRPDVREDFQLEAAEEETESQSASGVLSRTERLARQNLIREEWHAAAAARTRKNADYVASIPPGDDDFEPEPFDVDTAIAAADRKNVCESCLENGGHCNAGCVKCGYHYAFGCGNCDRGRKWADCHDDCIWEPAGDLKGKCVSATKLPTGRLLIAAWGSGALDRANSDGSELRAFIPGNTPCGHAKGSPTQSLVDGMTSRPTGLAVDEGQGLVFWTDWFGGSRLMAVDPDTDPYGRSVYRWGFNASILRASIADPGFVEPIVSSGEVLQNPEYEPILWEPYVEIHWPHFLDLDRTRQHVYWTDRLDHKIQRCNYDGSEVIDVLQTEGDPAGLAIDSAESVMYFADYNEGGSYHTGGSLEGFVLKKAGLDGSNIEAFLGTSGPVQGITVDLANSHIYFAAAGTTVNPGGIMRAGYSGRRRGKYGVTRRGMAYSDESDAVHLVMLPEGKSGVGRRRAVASQPIGVAGDWAMGQLYWSGAEDVSTRSGETAHRGLGGRLYRTNLCAAPLPNAHRRRTGARRPEGDYELLSEMKGKFMQEPYPADLAVLSSANFADGAGVSQTPLCDHDWETEPVPTTTSRAETPGWTCCVGGLECGDPADYCLTADDCEWEADYCTEDGCKSEGFSWCPLPPPSTTTAPTTPPPTTTEAPPQPPPGMPPSEVARWQRRQARQAAMRRRYF